jgi:DNA-binding LacI/PurR family transcriptional regulator
MQRESSARRTAVSYLNRIISKSRSHGIDRLPTTDELSRSARVAKGTMQKIVSAFVAQGVLRARTGLGITITGVAKTAVTLPALSIVKKSRSASSKGTWLREVIHGDIVNGRYLPGITLPTIKELCGRYGAGYGTIKRALGLLASDKQLVLWKRGYRVPVIAATRHQTTIIIAARGTDKGLFMQTNRMVEYLAAIEQECHERQIRIWYVPLHFIGTEIRYDDRVRRMLSSPVERQRILGALLFPLALPPNAIRHMAGMLDARNIPVSLIVEDEPFHAGPSPGRRVRGFRIAWGQACGEDVGRLLIQCGHKRAAYITQNTDSEWARYRYEGLKKAMASAKDPDPVACICLAGPMDDLPPLDLVSRSIPQLETMYRHNPVVARTLLWSEDQIRRFMQAYAQLNRKFQALEPILRDTGITAWVADNDVTAVLCLDLLQKRGIRVPEQVSVVGFDDSHAAMVNSLASYNFNCRAVMHAALKHVLAPSRTSPRRTPDAAQVEIQGYIVQRGTLGPVPRPSVHARPT